jgi:nitrogenase molybdenum-cofactor synthesis protein NifE
MEILDERKAQIIRTGPSPISLSCGKVSAAGSVSQRACVFCGSRVVLYPIADAIHLVHGPIGCAAYTWDIRGSLSSGPQLHRHSYSTDLHEKEVIFGGAIKLAAALNELIERHRPKAAFVYSTCIVGLIGDDVDAVCFQAEKRHRIPVLSVHSEGFKGTKKDGYAAACDALMRLVGTGSTERIPKLSINILGEFNLAGETWILQEYYRRMGIEIVSVMTGDGRVEDIQRAHGASLNLVQCSGSLTFLAKKMQEKYGIPFKRVSYFGIEDMAKALYDVAEFFSDVPEVMERAKTLVKQELDVLLPALASYRKALNGKKAAIYVGGGFKAFSLVKALRHLGIKTVLVGSQTGSPDDYASLQQICDPGTVMVDDSNPAELARFCREEGADLFIGGVKERPLAFKLGLAFVDHNHERKIALAGFTGMLNFAQEIYESVLSPVWQFSPSRNPS